MRTKNMDPLFCIGKRGFVLELLKRIHAITYENSVFTLSNSPTSKYNVFTQLWSPKKNNVFTLWHLPNKNNVFTLLDSRNHLPILKTYCILRRAIIFHLGVWFCTPNIQAPQATSEPVLMLTMHSRSFTNGGFACNALRTLWVRWMRTSIVRGLLPLKIFIVQIDFYTIISSHQKPYIKKWKFTKKGLTNLFSSL